MSENSPITKEIMQLPESVMIFGCGYVGAALAEVLLRAGVRVGALTRNPEKALRLERLGLNEVLVENLDNAAWHQKLSGSYTAVVNCVSSAGGGLEGYRKSYIEGQQSILEWTKKNAVQRYVYTSSTSVYPQDGGVEVDEAADTSTASPTGRLLCESEQTLVAASDRFDAWYVLRLAGIYGPGRHYLLDMLCSGETVIPGFGDYFLNLIHCDDIVSAICRALANDDPQYSGIYNLADNFPATKAEVVNWLGEALDVPQPRFDPDQTPPRLQRRGGRMPSRKILNHKFSRTFDWVPAYPDFRAGYRQLLNQAD
jgi:nucleoside-diphosphate-sugar epimerase